MCISCGVVFQRPNPLKSHIRYHCSATSSTVLDNTSTPPWTHTHYFPLPPPPGPWWLHGFPAAACRNNAYSPLELTMRSRGGNPVTSYAHRDVSTGNPAGTLWLQDCLQRLLWTDTGGGAAAATRTGAKLRDVTTSDDVTKLSDDVTTTNSTTASSERVSAADRPRVEGGGYECPYCGRSYSRRYGLKIHVRTHTGYKPLQCSVCRRAFGDPSNLNKHVRLHAARTQLADAEDSDTAHAPYRSVQLLT